MGEISFKAYHKGTGKVFHFTKMWVCTEYDSLAFECAEEDKGEYNLLAGSSGLPSNDVEDYEWEVESRAQTKETDKEEQE